MRRSDHSKQGIEAAIGVEIAEFFESHFLPMAHLDSHVMLEPQLIIGVQFGAVHDLWRTFGSTVRHVPMGAVAVGTGASWARPVLDGGIRYLASEHAATLTACYAIFCAKERSDSCGKDTHVFSLRDEGRGLLARADRGSVRAAEEAFRKYDALQKDMLNAIIVPPRAPVSIAADPRLDEIRNTLCEIDLFPESRVPE